MHPTISRKINCSDSFLSPLEEAQERGEVTLAAFGRGHFPGRRLPDSDLHGVMSLGTWDAHVEQSWSLELAPGDGMVLLYVIGGKLPFSASRRSEELEAGDFAIILPHETGVIGDSVVGPSRAVWVVLSADGHDLRHGRRWPTWMLVDSASLASLEDTLQLQNGRAWRADMEIRWAFDKLDHFCRSEDDPSAASRLKIILNSLLMAVTCFSFKPRNGEAVHKDQKVRAFLNQLPSRCDEPWTLESMAEQCGLRRSSFAAVCRQDTNLTPIGFLTWCRLARARDLLLNHREMSVTDAAYACGFHSSQYFATVFGRVYGQSPREWRSKHLL